MADSSERALQLQHLLDDLKAGDDGARQALIQHTGDRLRRLTRRMLRSYPGVHRWEQTDDVLQNALLRLHRSLGEIRPETARRFFALAIGQVRRELIDLARHHFGPEGLGANHATDAVVPDGDGRPRYEQVNDSLMPHDLAEWTEFHELVEALPDEEREVFGLIWYGGLGQAEVAALLEVSDRTIKRRWRAARIHLYEALQGEPPAT